jgi:hydrogenase-4 component F
MLAYSSVEHMGILALGVGLGGAATFGALLHTINHSLAKAALFFVAGNILAAYRTKAAGEVRGLGRIAPVSGLLWFLGFLAITGSPPFGLFLSEFIILKSMLEQGLILIAVLYLAFLAVVFVGMAALVTAMAQGVPPAPSQTPRRRESWLAVLPPAALAGLVLLLGVYVPPALSRALEAAAAELGRP